MGETVGLIGCGLMGAPMAARLVERGYDVIVFDESAAALSRAREIGCTTASTPRRLAGQAPIVVISLPRPEHVVEVVREGEDCLLAGMAEGSLIVDTSTVDPATSQENASVAATQGVGYLDCPILGRPSSAGHWTVPAGGEREHLAMATPVLETFAAKIVHVGPSGHGNMLKLLNNLMFGAINAATAELFAVAEKLGMEAGLLFDTIVNSGAATVSNLLGELGPKVVANDFTPSFTIDNLEKDIGLGLTMARVAGITLEFSEAGQRLNRAAQAAGLGGEDTAAVFKVLTDEGAHREDG